ncbi:MAG: glycosyltransferase family 2 protein [Polyangiaceae bacterium]|jgi:hypothetical protein
MALWIEPNEIRRAAIGRPRTAAWVGPPAGRALVEEAGARVVGEADVAERVDLLYVVESLSGGAVEDALARWAARLVDGGHVVVEHPERTLEPVLGYLRGQDLQPLWRRGLPGAHGSNLTIARRRPERRKLSLTVGMISMNEAAAVGPVIDSIRHHVPGAEVLMVDSSKDETPQIAEARGARVLRQFPPCGYGPAMTRLLYSATTDVVVTMDCDGTYPADRIGELHERIERGADLVNASRTHSRPKAMPLANYIANRSFAAIAGAVHGVWTTDLHSGMRSYRTSMLRGMYVREKGPALPVELLVVPARHGYGIEHVNIEYFERVGTSTLQRIDSAKWTFRRIANAALVGGKGIA